jgi:hypothetical protein
MRAIHHTPPPPIGVAEKGQMGGQRVTVPRDIVWKRLFLFCCISRFPAITYSTRLYGAKVRPPGAPALVTESFYNLGWSACQTTALAHLGLGPKFTTNYYSNERCAVLGYDARIFQVLGEHTLQYRACQWSHHQNRFQKI